MSEDPHARQNTNVTGHISVHAETQEGMDYRLAKLRDELACRMYADYANGWSEDYVEKHGPRAISGSIANANAMIDALRDNPYGGKTDG